MAKHIDNSDDVIDSRDVIARIEELESERDAYDENDGEERWADEYADDADELKTLKELADEASGYAPDWNYGEALIRDSYFVTYAQQLAEDIGAINSDATWPNTCIDWEYAARELKYDYTTVTFDGVDYQIRS